MRAIDGLGLVLPLLVRASPLQCVWGASSGSLYPPHGPPLQEHAAGNSSGAARDTDIAVDSTDEGEEEGEDEEGMSDQLDDEDDEEVDDLLD